MAVAPPVPRPVFEAQVLDVVAGLVSELGGGAGRRPNPDDALDRDLGISSLERVELMLRLEQAFGVRLPDSVMAEAATPRDLVTAILGAGPAADATPVVRQAAMPATAQAPTSMPTEARSLLDALSWHADRSPDRIHIHLRNDDGSEVPMKYGDLLTASTAVAGGLA